MSQQLQSVSKLIDTSHQRFLFTSRITILSLPHSKSLTRPLFPPFPPFNEGGRGQMGHRRWKVNSYLGHLRLFLPLEDFMEGHQQFSLLNTHSHVNFTDDSVVDSFAVINLFNRYLKSGMNLIHLWLHYFPATLLAHHPLVHRH